MLPLFLSLTGSGIDTEGRPFIGSFHLRDPASSVFAVTAMNRGLQESGQLAMTAAWTIILSIITHGITANPWARAYGKRRHRSELGTSV